MLLFIMLFIFFAGFALGEPWVSIIPGIYLAFKLIYAILEKVSDRAKELSGFEKKTTTIHHKYDDPFIGTRKFDEEITEWVKKEPLSAVEIDANYKNLIAERLTQSGYTDIQLIPDSGDFGADIIAVDKQGQKCCIKCNSFQGSVGVSAVQEVFSAARYYDCPAAIVITNSHFTEAAKKLASKLNVYLFENIK